MRSSAGRPPTWIAGLAAALIGGGAAVPVAAPLDVVASAVLAGIMAVIALTDMRQFRVPDFWNALAAAMGLVVLGLGGGLTAVGLGLLNTLICGGALFLLREGFFRLRGVEGLGFGDVKLAATGGLWLGWQLFAVAVLLAAFGALVWVASATMRQGAWQRQQKIALAAFLAPAIWLVWYGSLLLPPL